MPSVTRPLQLLTGGISWRCTGAGLQRRVVAGVSQPEGCVTASVCWCDECSMVGPTACGWAVG